MGKTFSYAHRSNFLTNLRKMFKYVGATAGNYSGLLKLMEATREDQQALVKGSVSDSIRKYVELDAAANQQVYTLALNAQCKLGLQMPELSVDARGEYFNVRVYFLDRECNKNQTAN